MDLPPIVPPQEWEAARQELLIREKELTRARDALPGVHGWPDRGCVGCSMMADQVAHVTHLNARDTTLAYVSRAPQADIGRLKAWMGWQVPWYTITDGFDADFGVDEWHGTNAFLREGDRIFRTSFVNGRGDEALGSTWSYLDSSALGRQEDWEDSLAGYPQTRPYAWWRRHDEYEFASDPEEGRVDDEPAASTEHARRSRSGNVMAHVAGVPVEELAPAAAGAGSAVLLWARQAIRTSHRIGARRERPLPVRPRPSGRAGRPAGRPPSMTADGRGISVRERGAARAR